MKIRSLSALVASGILLATATLALSGCGVEVLYKTPEYGYAGRPVPPSDLLERVLAAYTVTGTSGGGLEILDGLRDLRGNIQNTTKSFSISGYSAGEPINIINFPEQTTGYVLDYTGGTLTDINYSKESATGSVDTFTASTPSAAAAPLGGTYAGAELQNGILLFSTGGVSYGLNLPGVNKVAIDPGNSVVLAMVQNSNTLYRIVKLPATPNPVFPPGYVDCEPLLLPAYCVVPVGPVGTISYDPYDHPVNVSFSLDGSTAYVLNAGPEDGGATSSITFLSMAALNINNVPTVSPLTAGAPSPLSTLPTGIANPLPIPGGVTAAVSDGSYLYLAGEQLQTSGAYKGLFAGNLTVLTLNTYAVSAPVPISDGTHTKILLADDNTVWIGSSNCSNGVRAATATTELAAQGYTDQAGDYNCLTMATSGTTTPTAEIVPAVVQSTNSTVTAVPVAYPNTDQNQYYYGSLTGLCWVQNFHKVYTADGGQIHAFYTGQVPGTTPAQPGSSEDANGNGNGGPAGSEINNFDVTIQGNVLDVAYMDAQTNSAN